MFVLIPGPSVLFVISRGVALGRRAALLTVAGNSTGVFIHVVAVAAGIGAIVERSILAYNVLRLAGAAYIVWLGIQAIRHRRSLSTVLDATAVRPSRQIFREGFIVGITNPKSIVFFSAVLPQFVDPDGAAVPLQMLLLGAHLDPRSRWCPTACTAPRRAPSAPGWPDDPSASNAWAAPAGS